MSNADQVVASMCQSYESAVNASDSARYAQLFTQDAIRMPPGGMPEYGRDEIRKGEQADYDEAKWNVSFSPRDALAINDEYVYGIADIGVNVVPHDGGAESDFRLTLSWLLQRQASGDWLIQRQMWNRKPETA